MYKLPDESEWPRLSEDELGDFLGDLSAEEREHWDSIQTVAIHEQWLDLKAVVESVEGDSSYLTKQRLSTMYFEFSYEQQNTMANRDSEIQDAARKGDSDEEKMARLMKQMAVRIVCFKLDEMVKLYYDKWRKRKWGEYGALGQFHAFNEMDSIARGKGGCLVMAILIPALIVDYVLYCL